MIEKYTIRGKAVCSAVKIEAKKKDIIALKSKTSNLDCNRLVIDSKNIKTFILN